MSMGNDKKHSEQHPFIKNLGDKIADEAPSKYKVSPQDAYRQAGEPRGALMAGRMTCRGCSQPAVAYSMAGQREVQISGMCEPCFDFVMLHPDDREKLDEWMSLVEYNKKEG